MGERRAEAGAFLEALFGPEPLSGDLKIALWTKADKRSSYWPSASLAADAASGFRVDVYASVSLAPKMLGAKKRISNATSAGIPGLWADIDVVGGPEAKRVGAPSLEAALELARGLLEPSLTITSGYGLQAWWLLEDGPWIFTHTEERAAAAQMAAQWIALLDSRAREAGFAIDHTQDLARLMRVPGTVNAKGGAAAPVMGWPEPVVDQDGPRYKLEEISALARTAPANLRPTVQTELDANEIDFDPHGSPPADKFVALLENSDAFKRTWKHTRREGAEWSMSEWDLSLASQAVQAEWTDKEIVDLLAMHRREHGGEKLDRVDYFARTLAKARRQIQNGARDRDRRDALDELAELSEETKPDTDRTIAAFNRLVGGPAVKEFVQDGRDPQTARYTLVMANGDPVRIGRVGELMNQDRFRGAFLVVTGHVLPKVKLAEWDRAVQALAKVRQVRESEDDTPEGVVADWLSRYLYERLPAGGGQEARDAACERKEPFEDEGLVYVFAASFTAFVRQALRLNVPEHEVKDMLRSAGFERRTVHYEREDGRESTRSYYAGQREGID